MKSVRSNRQRTLLAALALRANETLSADALIDTVWGDDAPASARHALHVHVSSLRRQLDRAGLILETCPQGYELVLTEGALDADRFERRAAAGQAAMAAGDGAAAIAAFDDCLALWRGPALADVPWERFAEADVHRWDEMQQVVAEDRLEAGLALGHDVVGEAEALVAERPLRERRWCQLLVALYRAGRQVEALRRAQDVRALFLDEFGVIPGEELREVEKLILDQHPSLLLGNAPRSPAPSLGDGQRFVGRVHELGQLDAAYAAAAAGRGSAVVVSGEAGIGKTRFCEESIGRAALAGFRVVTARCWVDGGAPAFWPWQAILGELCGDSAVELLASDSEANQLDPDRFARFNAITEGLAGACSDTPVCVFVDDIHGADAGTLLLTRFVGRSLQRMRLILVLGRRRGEAAGAPADRWLVDQIWREATTVALGPFDPTETAELLSIHGLANLDDDLIATLHGLTGGNPFFLRRIAALGPPDSGALPTGVRVAIEQAIETLGIPAQRVLRLSAVLGNNPSIAEAAAVLGVDALQVLEAVAEAEAAGLVTPDEQNRFAFSHDLVRSTLEETMTAGERLDAHARAAAVLSGAAVVAPPDARARWAHHALSAAARSTADARRAIAACEAAAASMVRNFAYEQEDELLSAAVALSGPASQSRPSARLLVRWARAALHRGLMTEARERFARGVLVAKEEGDAVLLAEAALGLGGYWVYDHRRPVERARFLALQREARTSLPEDELALRCRLTARLAAEAVFDGDCFEPLLAALEEARRCGDPVGLAEVLSLCQHALLYPDHIETRLAMADEQVRIASEAGHGVLALMGLLWRAVALFHAADPGAIRALAELRERANAVGSENILWLVASIDVMLLVRAGRLEEAEHEAERCYALGEACGELDILGYYGAHILAIRWIQGRDGELLDTAKEMAASPTLMRSEFAFQATAAAIVARAGQLDYARGVLDSLAADGLASLPKSSTWLTGIVAIVETAAELDDVALAREAYDLLAPLARRPVMASVAMLCLGSTEWALASAAVIFGDLDRAIAHLESAITANRVLGNRPLRTIAEAELALALQRRGHEEDRERALELLRYAHREALDMGMHKRADEWHTEVTRLSVAAPATDVAGGPTRGAAPVPPIATRRGVLRRHHAGWFVALDEARATVSDLPGLAYLEKLLTRPGQPVSALSLAGAGTAPGESGDRQPVADPAGNADDAEQARSAIGKAIMLAVDAIDDAAPAIGTLLRGSLTTGTVCTYTPSPDDPITWSSTVQQ